MASGSMEVDAEVRVLAIDHVRAHRWAELLALQSQLERDSEYWTSLWGPVCSVAAYHEGRPAWELLVAVIDEGFHDLSAHTQIFADSFATEAGWPELRARMEANKPLPPIELTEWPTAVPALPVLLDRLDLAAEATLAQRVPNTQVTAQETALEMLTWVTSRWRHSSANHVTDRDANDVLNRVEAGERFACREYTIVLTQVLNAVGIPARPLALFRDSYHTGMGTGHAVTEAWLDDLGRWVVLDGQNGATWRDSSGALLGVIALQERQLAGDRPDFVGVGPNFDPDPAEAEEWFGYFQYCSTGGTAWRADGFVPFMEGHTVVEARPLIKNPTLVHPDLAEISTSVVDKDGGPALVFATQHPFATGFTVTEDSGMPRNLAPNQPMPLTGPAGDFRGQVATRTHYGTLRPSKLTYTLRRPGMTNMRVKPDPIDAG